MSQPYSKDLWGELFLRYLNDDILELAAGFPGKKRLIISCDLLDVFFTSRAGDRALEYFKLNPIECLEDAKQALHKYVLPFEQPEGWNMAGVEILNFQPVTPIRDVRNQHLETFISITGTIIRKTDVKFQIVKAAFTCARCGHLNFVEQIAGQYNEPFECENDVCGRKGPFKLRPDESEWADKRKIRLQETFDNITGGEQSLSILDAVMLEDVDCPPLGSTITASGVLKGIQTVYNNAKTPDFYPLLEINHLEPHDKEKTIEITPADRIEMEKLSQQDNIIDILVASTVPSIKGYPIIKEACLCSIVSSKNFILPDGRDLRGYSHVMLCGDPSTGKSMIMLGVQNLVPRAQYAAGRGASGKGLTVTVTKDKWSEGAWVAEAGMLVLADGALALIDEMDKWEQEQQQELNSALAHGKIPIHKAGINREYNTRCPVIAGLNPKMGRFDLYEPILKQVKVPPDTLSRFDLVFLITDEPKQNDIVIAEHITNIWVAETEKRTGVYKEKNESTGPPISLEMMRKWIAHAKTIDVRITTQCAKIIVDFFMGIRLQQIGEKDATVPIVFRTLDGMMRLLICQARLRLSSVTEEKDAQRVMDLVMESFRVMKDPTTGKMDSDIISTGISKSQRDRIRVLKGIITDLQDEYKSAVPLEDIISRAQESGINKDAVEDIIEKLKTLGEILEATNERFRVI